MKTPFLALTTAAFVAISLTQAAHAQTAPDSVPPEKCRVEPPADSGTDGETGQAPTAPLTETLDECGGVLKPPVIDDGGMAKSPPDEGTTPVIPPSALPEQNPSED